MAKSLSWKIEEKLNCLFLDTLEGKMGTRNQLDRISLPEETDRVRDLERIAYDLTEKLKIANKKIDKLEDNRLEERMRSVKFTGVNLSCNKKHGAVTKLSQLLSNECKKQKETIEGLEKKVEELTKERQTDETDEFLRYSSQISSINEGEGKALEMSRDLHNEAIAMRLKLEMANGKIVKLEKYEKLNENYCTQISDLNTACKRKDETIKELEKKFLESPEDREANDLKTLSKSEVKAETSLLERASKKLEEIRNLQEKQLKTEVVNKSEAIKELESRILELSEELKMRDLDENGRKVELSCLNLKYEKKCEELEIKLQDLWECKQKIAKLTSKLNKRKREVSKVGDNI